MKIFNIAVNETSAIKISEDDITKNRGEKLIEKFAKMDGFDQVMNAVAAQGYFERWQGSPEGLSQSTLQNIAAEYFASRDSDSTIYDIFEEADVSAGDHDYHELRENFDEEMKTAFEALLSQAGLDADELDLNWDLLLDRAFDEYRDAYMDAVYRNDKSSPLDLLHDNDRVEISFSPGVTKDTDIESQTLDHHHSIPMGYEWNSKLYKLFELVNIAPRDFITYLKDERGVDLLEMQPDTPEFYAGSIVGHLASVHAGKARILECLNSRIIDVARQVYEEEKAAADGEVPEFRAPEVAAIPQFDAVSANEMVIAALRAELARPGLTDSLRTGWLSYEEKAQWAAEIVAIEKLEGELSFSRHPLYKADVEVREADEAVLASAAAASQEGRKVFTGFATALKFNERPAKLRAQFQIAYEGGYDVALQKYFKSYDLNQIHESAKALKNIVIDDTAGPVVTMAELVTILENSYGGVPAYCGTFKLRDVLEGKLDSGTITLTPGQKNGGFIGIHDFISGSGYLGEFQRPVILNLDDMDPITISFDDVYGFVRSYLSANVEYAAPAAEDTPEVGAVQPRL